MREAGRYPKGIAKREEILQVALSLIANRGYNAATIRELADAVGLSKTGLLHHFGTKEELFAEILRRRDASDDPQKESATPAELEGALPEALRHNADVPGLVQLYTRFSAEATDPQNHAHHYFAERYARLRVEVGLLVKTMQDAGRIPSSIDPTSLAVVLVAAMDGLQLQWLYNPELDMAGTLGGLLDALAADRLPLR